MMDSRHAYDAVVIGASWGGVAAVGHLLSRLPATFRPPIVIAQHRGNEFDQGGLARVLGSRSALPLTEPDDKDRLLPGQVYLAPADYHLLIDVDGFALSTEGPISHSRPSIDALFESASVAFDARVIGVILTGSNTDGAAGLQSIHRRGGYTMVQDPTSAERPEMPAAALSATAVDWVGPLDGIAAVLVALCSDATAEATET